MAILPLFFRLEGSELILDEAKTRVALLDWSALYAKLAATEHDHSLHDAIAAAYLAFGRRKSCE